MKPEHRPTQVMQSITLLCPAPQAGQLQKETLYLETKTTSQSNDFSLHPFSQIRFFFSAGNMFDT